MISLISIISLVAACSTNGEMYKEGDAKNGEFSTWRTVMLPLAIAGVVVGAAAVGAAAAQPAYVDQPVAWRNPYKASTGNDQSQHSHGSPKSVVLWENSTT
jgi:hypothetical protein